MGIKIVFYCRHEREQTKVPGRVQGRERSDLYMTREGLSGREERKDGRGENREIIVREAGGEQSKGRP